MPEHGETDGERARGLTGKRAREWSGPSVKVEHRKSTHSCVMSTSFMSYLSVVIQRQKGWRMKNSDGRFGLFSFLDTAAFHSPSCGRPCSLCWKCCTWTASFLGWTLDPALRASCFWTMGFLILLLLVWDSSPEVVKTTEYLRCFHVGIGGVMCLFRVLLVCPSRFSNG